MIQTSSLIELNQKNLNNKLRPVWSVVIVMSPRGFNMAEKSTVSYLEEFLLVNAIRESRRCQNLQMVLKNLAAWRRKVLNVCFLLLLISSQRNNVTPVSRSCRRFVRHYYHPFVYMQISLPGPDFEGKGVLLRLALGL